MDDSKRLSLLKEYLSSPLLKTTFEKEKGLGKGCISRWLISFAIEDKPTIVNVALPMSKENDKTELLNPDDEIVCSVLNKLTLLTYQYETKQEEG